MLLITIKMKSSSKVVVVDNGSATIKAGLCGQHTPKVVEPPIVGRPSSGNNQRLYIGDDALSCRGILHFSYPIKSGVISKWDDMEKYWHHLFYDKLHIAPSDHNILLTEKILFNTPSNRSKTMEIMFEKFNFQSLFIADQSVLSLYASGRTTGIVLDVGNSVTSIIPIEQGFAVTKNSNYSEIGGKSLTDYFANLLNQRGLGYWFKTRSDKEIVRDIKEKLCYAYLDLKSLGGKRELDISKLNSDDKRLLASEEIYELPDGQFITIGDERIYTAEVLFKPDYLKLNVKDQNESTSNDKDSGKIMNINIVNGDGVDKLIYQSINKCDKNIQKQMYNNIVLSGGGSMIEQFDLRLKKEIEKLVLNGGNKDEDKDKDKDNVNVNVIAPKNRKYSVFVGGSILSSLSLFEQLWITKKDYSENSNININEKKVDENNNDDDSENNKDSIDWNLRFSEWNKNKMDDCCACSFESLDYLPIKNKFTKDELNLLLKQRIQYLCLGFLRKNNANPTDIIDIVVKYFGQNCNKFVVRSENNDAYSVSICASNVTTYT